MAKQDLKKGELAEERLRLYFLNLGYFVVRSIKADFKGFDITDVDLFLYSRPSPISRERTNVDVKMKQRPQALERIFWTKGLQDVLGLEKCIVATTDKRSHVGEFGAKHNVLVLDGNFMGKLDSTERYASDRLTEEELLDMIELYSVGELGGNWKKCYEQSKSNLLLKLNFDGVNHYLDMVKRVLEECSSGFTSQATIRMLYIYISFFLIALDYAIKDYSYKDQTDRVRLISDGIRFGEKGKAKSLEIISMSTALLKSFMAKEEHDYGAIEHEVLSQFDSILSDDIAEYLGSTKQMQKLFSLAMNFEKHGYDRQLQSPLELAPELQSIIGLLCDFHNIDRKEILIKFSN